MTTELKEFTNQQLDVIRRTLLPEQTSDDEFHLFTEQCYRTRLDPFARQIQGTPGYSRGKFKLTIVVTIDGFRAIADRSGNYAGQTEPEWCGPDGQWRTVWLEDKPPSAARCGVYRTGSQYPIYAVMTWQESPGPGSKSPVWKQMRAHMLHKCVEALALRKAFPNHLGGLYTNDEIQAVEEIRDTATIEPKPAAPQPAPMPQPPRDSEQQEQTIGEELRTEGTSPPPKRFKKNELLEPAEMYSITEKQLLSRANAMSPTDNPKNRINTITKLLMRPTLCQELVELINAGKFDQVTEPWDDDPEPDILQRWKTFARSLDVKPLELARWINEHLGLEDPVPNMTEFVGKYPDRARDLLSDAELAVKEGRPWPPVTAGV